jgi:hypothetical protein
MTCHPEVELFGVKLTYNALLIDVGAFAPPGTPGSMKLSDFLEESVFGLWRLIPATEVIARKFCDRNGSRSALRSPPVCAKTDS